MNVETIKALVAVYFYLEGEELDKEDVSIEFRTINKALDFYDIDWLKEACNKYIAENDFKYGESHEILFDTT
jgi:hypothetical protein